MCSGNFGGLLSRLKAQKANQSSSVRASESPSWTNASGPVGRPAPQGGARTGLQVSNGTYGQDPRRL